MDKGQLIAARFSGALSERTAFIVASSTRSSAVPEECKGFTRIRVDKDRIYYHWQIIPESQRDVFPVSSVPEDQEPYEFTLNRVIQDIENFQVGGEKPYKVREWFWQKPNFDRERVSHLIEQLEVARQRIRMYLTEPADVDPFLLGWNLAAKTGYNFTCDKDILEEELSIRDIAFSFPSSESVDQMWNYVDARLKAEIRAWQRTYSINPDS